MGKSIFNSYVKLPEGTSIAGSLHILMGNCLVVSLMGTQTYRILGLSVPVRAVSEYRISHDIHSHVCSTGVVGPHSLLSWFITPITIGFMGNTTLGL
jgi:hypothetical protein